MVFRKKIIVACILTILTAAIIILYYDMNKVIYIDRQRELFEEYKEVIVSEENNVLSPSGKYELEMKNCKDEYDIDSYYFVINNVEKGTVEFKSTDVYRYRDTSYLVWGNDDVVWLYHGDVGIFYWEEEGDSWIKSSYKKGEGDVPESLKMLRPKYFS